MRDLIDILVQKHRNTRAARRSFRKLLKGPGAAPWRLVTDKLRSYSAAHREVMPSVTHDTGQYANDRAEVSHRPTRQRKRQMRRFRSVGQAQRFLAVHGVIRNLFRLGRHHLRAENYRFLRDRSYRFAGGNGCLRTGTYHAKDRLSAARPPQVDNALSPVGLSRMRGVQGFLGGQPPVPVKKWVQIISNPQVSWVPPY
jgi:putative transposase